MRRIPWRVPAIALLLALPAGSIPADDVVTMTGEYYWEEGYSEGVLGQVTFTPTGKGTWDVAFHFRFRGRSHIYRGTAAGSLTEGALKGTVRNESAKRTFTFSGAFKNGTFQGTHSEIKRGRSRPTGTLILNG